MEKNKLLMIILIILVTITLAGVIAAVVVMKMNADTGSQPSIDEVLEASADFPEITTNLASGDFIRISFKIQTDNKKAKEELEKRDFQVKNIIIQELSEMDAKDLQGKEAQLKFQEDLKNKINGLMQEGRIEMVYITESLLQ